MVVWPCRPTCRGSCIRTIWAIDTFQLNPCSFFNAFAINIAFDSSRKCTTHTPPSRKTFPYLLYVDFFTFSMCTLSFKTCQTIGHIWNTMYYSSLQLSHDYLDHIEQSSLPNPRTRSVLNWKAVHFHAFANRQVTVQYRSASAFSIISSMLEVCVL